MYNEDIELSKKMMQLTSKLKYPDRINGIG